MYQNAFGLRNKPFGNTPDPAFFYFSTDHRQALVRVSQGIRDHCGLILLLGEVGTGKTTVCYHIHKHDDYLSAYLNNPYLNESEFLEEVNRGLRVPVGNGSKSFPIDDLKRYLLGQYSKGKSVVLVVDDAHRLGVPILDQILSLSNLQVPEAHLLQIILAGNPSILDTLRHPSLKSLNQRIGVRCHLGKMDYLDTVDYVNLRLERAGRSDRRLFTTRALETIWKASGGTPRLVNQLGERALNEAHYKGKRNVGKREVKHVVSDPLYQPLFDSRVKSWSMKTAFAGTALALFVGVSLGLWYFGIGSEFLTDTTTATRHLPVERQALVEKPAITPGLADRGGDEPLSTGAIVEEEALPVLVSDEATTVQPESQIYQTTHTAAILGPFRERLQSSGQILATHDSVDLKLSAIAWHEDPDRCIAVMNDKIVREGDFLGGLRVLRIKPDHIVLIDGDEHIIKKINTRGEDQNAESDALDPSSETEDSEIGEVSKQANPEQIPALGSLISIVSFDYNICELTHEARQELDKFVSYAKQSPHQQIIVSGYTDDVGPQGYNEWLSELRANMVESYLIENEIDPERITTAGMGEANPLMPNTTTEGRAANRRVEVELVPAEEHRDLISGG